MSEREGLKSCEHHYDTSRQVVRGQPYCTECGEQRVPATPTPAAPGGTTQSDREACEKRRRKDWETADVLMDGEWGACICSLLTAARSAGKAEGFKEAGRIPQGSRFAVGSNIELIIRAVRAFDRQKKREDRNG